MKKTFKSYSDAQHGWVAVKRSYLKTLGLLDKITAWSYQSISGGTVYLECDADVSLFVKALTDLNIEYHFENKYSAYSSIRSYPQYRNEA